MMEDWDVPVKKAVVLPLMVAVALVCFTSVLVKVLYVVAILVGAYLVVMICRGKLRGQDV